MFINSLAFSSSLINLIVIIRLFVDFYKYKNRDVYNLKECMEFTKLGALTGVLLFLAYFAPNETILYVCSSVFVASSQALNVYLPRILLRFIGADGPKSLKIQQLMMISPILTIIAMITNPFTGLYIESVTRIPGYIGFNVGLGPLLIGLSIWNGVVTSLAFIIALTSYNKYKYQDKRIVRLMFLGVLVGTVLQNVDSLFSEHFGVVFYFNMPIMTSVINMMCYLNFGYLKTARSNAMQLMDEIFVIFDVQGNLCYSNNNGINFFKNYLYTDNPKLDLFMSLIGKDKDSPKNLDSYEFEINQGGSIKYYNVSNVEISSGISQSSANGLIIKEVTVYREKMKILNDQATRDPLTGANNRRYFFEYIEELLKNADSLYPITLIMMDIDFFKKINDNHGHTIGDEVLKLYVERCYGVLRNDDILCRYGGEEFIVIAKNVSENQGLILAKRILYTINSKIFDLSNVSIPVTASVGVCTFQSNKNEDVQKWIDIADKCLYQAKESGRNRVVYFGNKNRKEEVTFNVIEHTTG